MFFYMYPVYCWRNLRFCSGDLECCRRQRAGLEVIINHGSGFSGEHTHRIRR